jgi:chitinase
VPDCQQNIPPVAEANGPYTGLISQGQAPVTFSSAGSSDPDGTIQTYTWDFGDGSAPGGGQNASHDYAIPGVYTVILNVIDNCGAGGQDTTKVTIAIPK